MNATTIFLIILSIGVAFTLSFYQYIYKAKNKSRVVLFLAFLRFMALFLICILIINPTIKKETLETTKPILPIVVDNSSSIHELQQTKTAEFILSELKQNKKLNDYFSVQYYSFSKEIELLKKLDFKGNQTNISAVGQNFSRQKSATNYPLLLLSDGNQTSGTDYTTSFGSKANVFPIVIGDTLTHPDLTISQLNVNSYALQGNKFPVELFIEYNGKMAVQTSLSIENAKKEIIYKEPLRLSAKENSKIITVMLTASTVGIQIYKSQLKPLTNEKNTYNNQKSFAVEVINQKTKVALISSINHPDIGALKRAIETNKLREVFVLKPNEIKNIKDFDVLLCYQPNTTFKAIFDQNKTNAVNTWVITGTQTDYAFLNQNTSDFLFEASKQTEDYRAEYATDFSLFTLENKPLDQFPPLENSFLKITSKTKNETLLKAKIRSISTNMPLLTFTESNQSRKAYLFGENCWKWRLQTFVTQQNFESFDVLTDKIIQYLATNSKKNTLTVQYEKLCYSANPIEISAQFFNKNYEFDANAQLSITVINKQNKKSKQYDMLRTAVDYKANFDGLEAGSYAFTVTEKKSKATFTGVFDVLEYDMEKHFVNPNQHDLSRLAANTNGKLYYPNQIKQVVEKVLNNEQYKPIQKSVVKSTPLIDWYLLLILLVFLLSTEWFVRKYNGLL